ncbi:MAG: ral secretion pathway protein [Sphingomonas bacterium]|jgi:general secretion pathway protein M|nr:ral secretion pathway protein [Sphingomonas bacterium]MDB5718859.1 ral secretion pathway protein [Sphingomonas bacterium]
MIARLTSWWRLRDRREQRLLLIMIALFVIVFAWLGVVRPLGDRLADARERHGRAVLALAAAQDQAERIVALQRSARPPQGLPVGELVSRAAAEAGFTAATVTPAGATAAAVSIPAVRTQAFFAWVADLQRRYGLIVQQLSARTNSDATLAVEVSVRGRAG